MMKNFAVLFIALTLISLTPAMAQDVFITNDKDATQAEQIPIDPNGKTPVSKDIANQFFEDCVTKENAIFTGDSQEMFCACTSAKITEEMSMEEIRTMFEDTPEGQDMRNLMLIRIYTPCMEFPIHDLVYKSCMGDKNLRSGLKKPRSTCECMGSEMAAFVVERAPASIIRELRLNPQNLDPMGSFLNGKSYNTQTLSVQQTCLSRHEYGR